MSWERTGGDFATRTVAGRRKTHLHSGVSSRCWRSSQHCPVRKTERQCSACRPRHPPANQTGPCASVTACTWCEQHPSIAWATSSTAAKLDRKTRKPKPPQVRTGRIIRGPPKFVNFNRTHSLLAAGVALRVWHCSLARRCETDLLVTSCLSACELAVLKCLATWAARPATSSVPPPPTSRGASRTANSHTDSIQPSGLRPSSGVRVSRAEAPRDVARSNRRRVRSARARMPGSLDIGQPLPSNK
jgi:hypothetical protein